MNQDIAARLVEYRLDAGLSQEKLAERLSVSRQAVSKWERAESLPDIGNVLALEDLYDVTVDELLRGEGARKPGMQHRQRRTFQYARIGRSKDFE